jgi:hypothetical protein
MGEIFPHKAKASGKRQLSCVFTETLYDCNDAFCIKTRVWTISRQAFTVLGALSGHQVMIGV